jgi:hypothetical protein
MAEAFGVLRLRFLEGWLMFAALRISCPILCVTALMLLVADVAGGHPARPLGEAALCRVRGLDNESTSVTMEMACGYATFGQGVTIDCTGKPDDTDCYACGTEDSRLAQVDTECPVTCPIEPSGPGYLCGNLTQFTGTCEDGECVGDYDEDVCQGRIQPYSAEPEGPSCPPPCPPG